MQKCEQNPSDKRILNELYATKLRLQTIMRQKQKAPFLGAKLGGMSLVSETPSTSSTWKNEIILQKQSQGSNFVTIR